MTSLNRLSHGQLLAQLRDLIGRDHTLEAELVAHLGEVDARRLYLEQACPSMFHYCVHVLHFAEGVAYKRIAVARAARRFPELRVALGNGGLHLTGASLIAPHLDRECAAEWVSAARHQTAQEIKRWIADRKPKADVASSVRRAPAPRLPAEPRTSRTAAPSGSTTTATSLQPGAASLAASAPVPSSERDKARCEPFGAKRYFVRFVANEGVHEELQELRALLRHQIPDGDVAKIIGRAVHSLLEQVRKKKTGACASPRPSRTASMPVPGSTPSTPDAPSKTRSRSIPAAIRRAVWARDGGCCTYVSREGRKCRSREFLEFHHHVPWARCREHAPSNIHLRCRAHNQHAAESDFGSQQMAPFRKRGSALAAEEADAGGGATDPVSQLDSNPVGHS